MLAPVRTSSALGRVDGLSAAASGNRQGRAFPVSGSCEGEDDKGRGQWPAYEPCLTSSSTISRELTAGRQSPLMSGRAGRNMGGDASWRCRARGDAARGRSRSAVRDAINISRADGWTAAATGVWLGQGSFGQRCVVKMQWTGTRAVGLSGTVRIGHRRD